jgi:hypothetical protein
MQSKRVGTIACYSAALALVTPAWLLAATDEKRVRVALERMEPDLASDGPWTIRTCKVKLRALDADGRWLGRVPLQLEGRDGAVADVTLLATFLPPALRQASGNAVEGTFGKAGWHCSVPALGLELTVGGEDHALPARDLLLDPQRVRPLLESSLRSAEPEWRNLRITHCDAEVRRYKPGSRCTVLYRLEYADVMAAAEAPPNVVVAKARAGGAGTETFGVMQALWTSPLGTSSTVRIARPLGYHPEIGVLVQGPVPGNATLKEIVEATFEDPEFAGLDRVRRLLQRTARGLAELHACGVTQGRVRSCADERAEVLSRLDHLTHAIPALEGFARPLLEQVDRIFRNSAPPRLVPSHGGFRGAQVLVNSEDIGFIDFDPFCQAEAAMDLAEFVRFLLQEAFGEPDDVESAASARRLAVADELVALVLDTYRAEAEIDLERITAWQALGGLQRLLAGWAKGKTGRLAADAWLLDHFLLDHGLPRRPFA